jgi:hypothetical protein
VAADDACESALAFFLSVLPFNFSNSSLLPLLSSWSDDRRFTANTAAAMATMTAPPTPTATPMTVDVLIAGPPALEEGCTPILFTIADIVGDNVEELVWEGIGTSDADGLGDESGDSSCDGAGDSLSVPSSLSEPALESESDPNQSPLESLALPSSLPGSQSVSLADGSGTNDGDGDCTGVNDSSTDSPGLGTSVWFAPAVVFTAAEAENEGVAGVDMLEAGVAEVDGEGNALPDTITFDVLGVTDADMDEEEDTVKLGATSALAETEAETDAITVFGGRLGDALALLPVLLVTDWVTDTEDDIDTAVTAGVIDADTEPWIDNVELDVALTIAEG